MSSARRTRLGAVALTVCGLSALGPPAAHAGKPAPPPPPPSVVATSFSGHAKVVGADLGLLGIPIASIALGDTGDLPSGGGFVTAAPLLSIPPLNVAGLSLTGEAVSGLTTGNGLESDSFASVASAGVGLAPLAMPLLDISAGVLQSSSHAACNADGTTALSGSSTIADLVVNGTPIVVGTMPNQVIAVPGVASITINEQVSDPATGSITVNALHVRLDPAIAALATGDIVVSSAHSDIHCSMTSTPPPPSCTVRDFVTGGGYVMKNGEKVTFSTVGGIKSAGGLTGHLNVVDHNSGGQHLQSQTLTAYADPLAPSTQRDLTFTLGDGSSAKVHVADNGEPGTADVWSIASTPLTAGTPTTPITHGNIQLHLPKGCQPAPTTTKGGKGH